MQSKLLLTVSALLAAATAVPLEGEGGLVIQGGNGNTRLGMFYKPIQSILGQDAEETSIDDSESDSDLDSTDDANAVEAEIAVAERMPQPVAEEMIVIMDATPANPEFVMPGLSSMLTPQRLSPPSPVEQALEAVEEMIEGLKHGVLPDDAQFDVELEVNFPDRASEPEFPDFGALLESVAPTTAIGDAMMIEIFP
ncbi:hypothetical protein TWF696_002971 [Orbilia brochopaga]|uniref:Uncharacterized protein n=1 Tax=Orbilia brochopaga TaxID=3140254 RepID=A0AAV9TYN9_9PEZI